MTALTRTPSCDPAGYLPSEWRHGSSSLQWRWNTSCVWTVTHSYPEPQAGVQTHRQEPGAGKTWSWWHAKGARAPHEATDPEMSSSLLQMTASAECLVFILQAKGNVCPICTKQAAVYHPFTPGCRDTRARLDRRHTITTRCHQFTQREGKVTCFTCPGTFPRLWSWCV